MPFPLTDLRVFLYICVPTVIDANRLPYENPDLKRLCNGDNCVECTCSNLCAPDGSRRWTAIREPLRGILSGYHLLPDSITRQIRSIDAGRSQI